jgi:hypothetical protein
MLPKKITKLLNFLVKWSCVHHVKLTNEIQIKIKSSTKFLEITWSASHNIYNRITKCFPTPKLKWYIVPNVQIEIQYRVEGKKKVGMVLLPKTSKQNCLSWKTKHYSSCIISIKKINRRSFNKVGCLPLALNLTSSTRQTRSTKKSKIKMKKGKNQIHRYICWSFY